MTNVKKLKQDCLSLKKKKKKMKKKKFTPGLELVTFQSATQDSACRPRTLKGFLPKKFTELMVQCLAIKIN